MSVYEKMKLTIISAITAVGSLSAAKLTEDDKTDVFPKAQQQEMISYGYFKLADQWGVFPGFGGGYRSHDMHGFDVDLTAYSYFHSGFMLYGKTHYLFYPQREHFYLGIGAGCIGGALSIKNPFAIFGSSSSPKYGVKPTLEGVIGYEWQSLAFLQLEVGISYGRIPFYPVLSFGMGF